MTTSTKRSTAERALVIATADGLRLPTRTDAALAGQRIDSIAVDGDTLWILTSSDELFRVRGTGDGERVTALRDGSATCVHVHRGAVYVGGDDAGLWRLRDKELEPVESFQQAPTRADWSTPWGGPPSVLSMASHADDLYVGVHVGGIIRSSDDGETWTDTIDLDVDVHQVVVADDGVVWAATGHDALAASDDRGSSWTFHAEGLHATYSLALALTSAGVLTGASSGHAGRDGAVYLFDGARFERVEGLPESLRGAVGPRQIVGDGNQAALIAPGGAVYVSDDGGRVWHALDHVEGATALALV